MIYKVGICGATGRMGLELVSLLGDGLQLGTDRFEFCDAVASSGKLTSLEGIAVRTLQEPPREPVHVWIDFSSPAATIELLGQIDTPLVIATTGLHEKEIAAVTEYSKTHPVILCANTSAGISWLTAVLRKFPPRAELGYQAVVEETHHVLKKDAPSGTAKQLCLALERAGFEDPTVHVTRAGDVVGVHRVRFIGTGEEIILEHRVSSRSVFARGALIAAQYLLKRSKPGLYSIDEVVL